MFRIISLVCLLAFANPVFAQEEPAAPEPELTDPFDRLTPRSTVDGLIAAFAESDTEAVQPFLDLSDIPESRRNIEGRRLATRLQEALDRGGVLLPGFRLSSSPEGDTADGLPPDQDLFAQVMIGGTDADLTLLRSPSEDGTPVWRVSPASLAVIAELGPLGAAAIYETFFPERLREWQIAGASAASWLAALVLGAVAVVLAATLVWTLFALVLLVFRPMRDSAAARLVRPMRLPMALVIAAPLALALSLLVGIPVVVRAAFGPIVETAIWLAVTWMLLRLVHAVGQELLESMTRRGRLGAVSVIALGRRIAIAIVVLIAAALIASSFGLNLAGWLAAFGIGGIAIALGAQKTIEHLVGGVSIIADQPIRVGDFCRIDTLLGTIEDIGLRSTRIRTLDRTLVTIPNGDLSSARIENYANRDRFLWKTLIGLRYETTPDQMRGILRQLELMLLSDDRIAENPRARFVAFGASSLDIEIFAHILAKDYPASLEIREEMNLTVMDIVEKGGSGFAFPSQTVYFTRDEGLPDT
ncbi:mechanosensitive ion channel family protein [Jannaschia aquimarina]|uniref:YnaI protein n=1 Tax=Jannaschia aquimarina TaxID=935700 RepID=A0A0D1ECC3_9RHOB|nr:mechanosensitive ion channel family protein [Jannaschia aquimarina]KIT14576.1 Low conductance mechanosensitive channel YnaI [Jannaschia aquimarina]SNT34980.1 MscS family membrane protein [Jannaschia aquimarina]